MENLLGSAAQETDGRGCFVGADPMQAIPRQEEAAGATTSEVEWKRTGHPKDLESVPTKKAVSSYLEENRALSVRRPTVFGQEDVSEGKEELLANPEERKEAPCPEGFREKNLREIKAGSSHQNPKLLEDVLG